MGLDITFSRQEAIDCGFTFEMARNGSDEQIKEYEVERAVDGALAGEYFDEGYYDWLNTEIELINIPHTSISLVNDGTTTSENCIVRANKWGPAYLPLTTWLKINRVEWQEW